MRMSAVVAAAVLLTGSAVAENTALTIAPGHSTVIRQYVTTQPLPAIVVKIPLELGTVVPDAVKTRPVPLGLVAKVPEIRNYEYFAVDGKVVFVEPYTRRIVQIVQ